MVYQELKIYSISHVGDCVSPHISRWWLDQEVWWSINKERAHSNISTRKKKKVFTKCFGDTRSNNWISGVQSRARHGNSNGNRGNILLTECTECLKNYGQAQHWSSRTVWGCTCDSQLHRGRHQQLRTSQGHGPNWQGHLQFWFSKTSFHTSLPSLLSTTGHSSYNLQGIYCFFFCFFLFFFNGSLLFQ